MTPAERSQQGRRNKANGSSFEVRVRKELVRRGWFAVKVGGSLGCADVVAIRKTWLTAEFLRLASVETPQVLLVQAKRNGTLPPHERSALFQAARECGAVPVLARMPEGKTRGLEFYRLTGIEPKARERFEP